jgi:hypothetical protein
MNIRSWFTNLFGTIASSQTMMATEMDFLPLDANGKTIDLRTPSAQWLGLENPLMQKFAYEYCYPVASIFDRLAEYDLNGEVEILNSTGKGKDNYAKSDWAANMNRLFTQPNHLQSWEQFRGQQIIYKRTFGYCPVMVVFPVGFSDYPMAMVNLPPWLFDVKRESGNILAEGSDIKYVLRMNGREIDFDKSQIIILEDSFHQDENKNFLLPKSKLVGLDMAVSNICAAMEADNVLLKKKGPLGFISHDAAATKDSQVGYLPMTKAQRKELQNALQAYGMSWTQYQYVISRQAVKWQPMSYNINELGTKETVIAGEKAICHRYNFPYILYEMSDSAYSANGTNAEKNAYTSNVIPNNTKDFNKYNKFFKAELNKAKITCCFDDVPCLQEDRKTKAEADKAQVEGLEKLYNLDMITVNEFLQAIGRDTITDGDVYKSQRKITNENEDPTPKDIGVAA